KSALTAEVSVLKVTVTQKDHDISLLNSRATCLASTLDDAKVVGAEAGDKITSLASKRDRLASEVSSLRADFQDFKERMDIQQEEQAQELFNRVAELEAHRPVMSMRLPGEIFSAVDAYNPEVAKASYINAVKALEDVDFPLVNLLKSKKDAGMDELSIPIYHVGDKTAVGETSLSFALMNVHARAAGAKKHVASLRQLMMEIVSAHLSS
ncbi:hypothetical protein Tco_0834238, partial [Tanacetum coccineum]